MTVHPITNRTSQHWMLDLESDAGEINVVAEADPDGADVTFIASGTQPYDTFILSGPPAAVLEVVARAYRALKAEVDKVGPECRICGKRGVNRGDFAQPTGRFHVHIGCGQDDGRARKLEVVRDE